MTEDLEKDLECARLGINLIVNYKASPKASPATLIKVEFGMKIK